LFGAKDDILGFKVNDGGRAFMLASTFEIQQQQHQQQQQQQQHSFAPPGQFAGRVSGDDSQLTMKDCRIDGLTHGINVQNNCRLHAIGMMLLMYSMML
jgi:hypothetical protein